ncbi:MAG: nucleoside monophosphate kinase [bacterium]
MLPNLHILGIQGSGKGTQSSLLVEKYGLSYISSGNLFRERSQQNDELGQIIAQELKAGRLLPDLLLFRVLEQYLDKGAVHKGLLADGVIRTLAQYEGLEATWKGHSLEEPFLIHLVLSEKVAVERIHQREKDVKDLSKAEYHKTYSGKLAHRTDDNPKAIQERFALFHEMTTPVIKRFEASDRCVHISADRSVEEIHADICHEVEKAYPSLSPIDVHR